MIQRSRRYQHQILETQMHNALDEARTEVCANCRMKFTVVLPLPLISFLRDLLVTFLCVYIPLMLWRQRVTNSLPSRVYVIVETFRDVTHLA